MEWRGRIGPTDEVTLDEAAKLLGAEPSVVAALVAIGEIPARTNCSVTHISLADIEVFQLRVRVGPRAHEVGEHA